MIKTIKIIDLLVAIANGKEVPKKIKWEDTIFAYSEHDKDYLEYPFSDEEYKGLFCMKDSILTQYLNDEVEIIEEDKQLKEILAKLKDNDLVRDCNDDSVFKELNLSAIKTLLDYIANLQEENKKLKNVINELSRHLVTTFNKTQNTDYLDIKIKLDELLKGEENVHK